MDKNANSRDDITACRRLDYGFENNAANNNEEKEDEILDLENGDEVKDDDDLNSEAKIPRMGKEFDSDDAAYEFYNEYARATGFSIRRGTAHKDRQNNILDRTFHCSCEGHRQPDKRDVNVKTHRPETRTNCLAKMKISARRTGKYEIVEFVAEHNGHKLVTPKKSHFLRSHRSISDEQAKQIDDFDKSGVPLKAALNYMAEQVGGREYVGCLLVDVRNYLRTRRMMEMKAGEAGGALHYLQMKQSEDPNFFYAVQVDIDDLVTNVFWADTQMMADYVYFGDVVCFDTTYRKLKEGRPFALFVGANHHRQTTVFGAALLYDETAETFMWLFDTFVKAMNGKKPTTILTDQDAAMAKALEEKWPETCHRLCIWHIYKNAASHLGTEFGKFPTLIKDFNSCVYNYEEEEEFLNAWQIMLDKYALQDNDWLERLFSKKEKWALVYGRQKFCADMTTTQRSESIHGVLKHYVSTQLNLIQFFQHFGRLVDDRRYEEMKADVRTNHSIPSISFLVEILKHARSVYTHEVFKLFQEEMIKGHDSKLETISEVDAIYKYKITPFEKKYPHTVTYNASEEKVSCSCKKFEFAGILCSHALKVLTSRNIVKIPELYIMKRWTKQAKKGIDTSLQQPTSTQKSPDNMEEEYEKVRIKERNKDLSRIFNQLTTRASLNEGRYESTRNSLIKMIEEMDISPDIPTSKAVGVQVNKFSHNLENSLEVEENVSNETLIRGWKTKESKGRSGKRIKSGLEQSKKKSKPRTKLSSSQSSSVNILEANSQNSNSSVLSTTSLVRTTTSCPSVPSYSQFSQNYPVDMPGWNSQYPHLNFQNYSAAMPSWNSQYPHLNSHNPSIVYPFQFMSTTQLVQQTNASGHQPLNSVSQNVEVQRGSASLTELLQRQMLQQREFRNSLSNDSAIEKQKNSSTDEQDTSPQG